MPDLSLEAAHQFWSQYHDPMIYRVLAFMEGVESWTSDSSPKLEEALKALGQEMETLEKVDLTELAHESLIIPLCGHLKMSRVLRIMQIFDIAHPGSASKLLIHAEENSQNTEDPAGLFLRRNIVFERLRLLGRVFSPERCELVLKALEKDHA